jgi:hypothetical protein
MRGSPVRQSQPAARFRTPFLGDDLPDLTITSRVGLAVAVHIPTLEVRCTAHELVELILRSKGIWVEMIDKPLTSIGFLPLHPIKSPRCLRPAGNWTGRTRTPYA